MTHLRRIVLGASAAALMMTGAVSKSFAVEPGDFTNYLRGATQGLPLGALPPPGIYGGFALNATGLGASAGRGNQAIPGAGSAPVAGYGANLLFVPGWKIFGADYGAAVVQGFYFAMSNTSVNPPFAGSGVTSPELANTTFTPISLSWNLSHGFFAAVALNIVGPDGSRWASTPAAADLNPDYWTIAPGFAISYLDANWLLSANMRYDISTASPGTTMLASGVFLSAAAKNGFVTGNELFVDFTALYKVGKWSFGPVGYIEAQTTADRPGGGQPCTNAAGPAAGASICGWDQQGDLGFLIGYDFGPVAVQVWADDTLWSHDNIGYGWDVWGRMSFRIWAPEAAKPLVAKN
jgi:hypothetical protein